MTNHQARKLLISVIILFHMMSPANARGQKETQKPEPLKPFNGTVDYLEGEVHVDGAEADLGHEVRDGSTVQTAKQSLCEILFDESNVFRIEENTILSISSEGQKQIELRTGVLAGVFTKLRKLSSETNFEIRTPTAVAGIRATVFYVKVEKPSSVYVCICNGSLALSDDEGNERFVLEAQHHKARRFIRENGGIVVETAPVLYHSDEYMNRLAEKIDFSIPW